MKSFYLTISLAFFVSSVIAQIKTPCLYDHGVRAMEESFPGFREAADMTFRQASQSVHSRTNEVYTIPVVVHVVWKEPAENIPLTQIEAQIEELNRCYRRQNPDTINLRSIFHPVAGDPKIAFELKEVIRVQTSAVFQPTFSLTASSMPDEVKQQSKGGSDAADPDHFLNIWVCKIQPLVILGQASPILGYAYPPANLANWPQGSAAPSKSLEGVVIDFGAFGTDLRYTVPGVGELPILGRTVVHEVGHYLGLRHISGDGLLGLLGIPDCSADDGVADTPNQGFQSQFDCNPAQNTCNDGSDDLPDMIENFMDYSREDCQNTFTKEQVSIMRNVLEGPRAGLLGNPTSVSNGLAFSAVPVFPNPSDGLFQWDMPARAGTYSWMVFDAFGNASIQPTKGSSSLTIDLSHLPKGLYLLVANFDSGEKISQKLVKL